MLNSQFSILIRTGTRAAASSGLDRSRNDARQFRVFRENTGYEFPREHRTFRDHPEPYRGFISGRRPAQRIDAAVNRTKQEVIVRHSEDRSCDLLHLARNCFFNYPLFVLPSERPSPEQIAVLRAMSGETRLRLSQRLYWSARKLKAAGLRNQHPDWPDDRVNAEVIRIFRHGRS